MTTKLGVYYAPEHSRQSDRDYIAALQPRVIRILDPDVQQIADMHALAPNAIIAPRTWVIDDNGGAAVRNLMADPVGTGYDHAQQYAAQWDRWTREAAQRGLRLPNVDRILFNSANEPNQGGTPDKIATYNLNFLQRCTELGICAAALCLGVGWPDNTGPDTPVNWTPYAELPAAIKRNGGMLELHEYNYKTGPQDGWRWLAGRHLQCPFDVPILLGEIGIDNYVDKARWDREGGNRGWQGNVSPDTYAEMIEYHISHSDSRVVAGLIFITDFRNREWQSFDTGSAHQALLARKDSMIPQAAPPKPVTTHLPSVTKPAPSTAIGFVAAPSGLNLRTAPTDGDIITAIAYGELVTIIGVGDSGWLRVRHGDVEGWAYGQFISVTAPEPTPTAPPPGPGNAGDNWARSIAFVRRWEGGWADDPNDPGGATNHGITLGTYTRWRQAHGQPKPSKDDLRNISDAEANQIFYEWYWLESGSDKLAWPLCLANFDTAVNAGTGRARETLHQSGGVFTAYMGHLISWYARIDGFQHFGRAWMRRRAEILLEASK